MITIQSFANRPVAVFGLGRGRITAAALAASGADVWAWDDNVQARDRAKEDGLPLVDLYNCDWSALTTLVLSPGIPHTHPKPHPVALLAQEAGCEIIGDIELLIRSRPEASYIGVTGTNGKSTTTALIGHILKSAGCTVEIGGNLGIPVLGLMPLAADGIYVLELSSYQLDLTPSLTCDVAVLLNISADHLARHGGMEGYIAAKKQIFGGQNLDSTAVVGDDDDSCRAILADLRARRAGPRPIAISGKHRAVGGVHAADGQLTDEMTDGAVAVIDLKAIQALPGEHNWQNAAAAFAATRAFGIEPGRIAQGMRHFPGLAHRQERIATIDGIAYVNDSKATNADATAKALLCYDAIYWILGGQGKEGGVASLVPYLDRVRHTFLIGQSAGEFADSLSGKIALTQCGTLDIAVARAREQALADGATGTVVLLSPAAASFDQFTDFEARGAHFRALVEALPGRKVEGAVH
jgi:UDP-N-acetylmuramoylalanine--D-glutamate ligase